MEGDKALKKRLQALRESRSSGQGAMHVLLVQRLRALGRATNKMGYEKTAYLALAATAAPSGSEPIEVQTCAN